MAERPADPGPARHVGQRPRRGRPSVPIELRTFPSGDAAFAAFAGDALARDSAPTPLALQGHLRERYPLAVVRRQEDFARDAAWFVWYAFRYGSANPPRIDWSQAHAQAVLDEERRFVTLNDELAAIVELPRGEVVGRRLDDFTNPDDPTAATDLAALWLEFVRVGAVASTLRYNHRDGRPRELAFRIVADAEGPGLHRLLVRPVVPAGP